MRYAPELVTLFLGRCRDKNRLLGTADLDGVTPLHMAVAHCSCVTTMQLLILHHPDALAAQTNLAESHMDRIKRIPAIATLKPDELPEPYHSLVKSTRSYLKNHEHFSRRMHRVGKCCANPSCSIVATFSNPTAVNPCDRCLVSHFCSTECQRANYAVHRPICTAICIRGTHRATKPETYSGERVMEIMRAVEQYNDQYSDQYNEPDSWVQTEFAFKLGAAPVL